jgi:hypothetical protein
MTRFHAFSLVLAITALAAGEARAQDAPEQAPAPTETPPPPAPATPSAPYTPNDELAAPGYIPGYDDYPSLGLSPFVPRAGAPAGNVTTSFGAPSPLDDWLFTWSGYMSASLQISIDRRESPQPGQKKLVFHAPPIIVEEYASFTSTNSLPGNWIGANFNYGNRLVTATVQIATWNPTRPTNHLSPGSQYFINDIYLRFRAPPVSDFRVGVTAGFFSLNYGELGRYGGGFYTNAMTGGPIGAGYMVNVERDLGDLFVLNLEQGFMGPRAGAVPMDVVGGTAGGDNNDPQWTGGYTNHVHAGLLLKGETQIQGQLHYLSTWAQNDRIQRDAAYGDVPEDNPQTREIDESYVRDPRLHVVGFDVRAISRTFGVLGVGGAYIDGYQVFPLRNVITYGGDGERLTSSWWGPDTHGTGTLLVGGISYSMSLTALLMSPQPFSGNGPDLQLDAGFNIARSTSADPVFDGRVRHKYGISALYTFIPYLGVGARVDRVVPSSHDPEQTYHVLAPRLQIKTDWQSHEAIVLSYVKWFMGSRTHLDGTQPRSSERIDDEMFTLNFNMWW